jgi:hypothetical protein
MNMMDENDRLRAGTLPRDPAEDCVPMEDEPEPAIPPEGPTPGERPVADPGAAMRSRAAAAAGAADDATGSAHAGLPEPKGGRGIVIVGTDMARMVDDGEAQLLRTELGVYSRAGKLVHIRRWVRDDPDPQPCSERAAADEKVKPIRRRKGGLVIAEVATPSLREYLSRAARWFVGKREVMPPKWLAETLAARGQWNFPELVGFAECPMFRMDGSLLTKSGYDAASGLFCDFAPEVAGLDVPDSPTQADAQAALAVMSSILAEFPFAGECHRAAALSLFLTVVVRNAIDGPCPLFAVDSPTPGSGKGLLVDCAAIMAIGRRATAMSQADNREEEGKRIMSIGLAGDPLVLIDNVKRPLGSGHLEAALTSWPTYAGRILGKNQIPHVPLQCVWMVTGNNVKPASDDMARRILPIRITPGDERPEERTFAIPKLREHVLARRRELVRAALVVVGAWLVAGKPEESHFGLRPMGSFEEWSQWVRCAIVHAGAPDPLEGQKDVRDSSEVAALGRLLAALESMYGDQPFTTAKLAGRLKQNGTAEQDAAAALGELVEKEIDTRSLGYLFRRSRDRVACGRALSTATPKKGENGNVWQIRRVGA